jgi:hypothetical protein
VGGSSSGANAGFGASLGGTSATGSFGTGLSGSTAGTSGRADITVGGVRGAATLNGRLGRSTRARATARFTAGDAARGSATLDARSGASSTSGRAALGLGAGGATGSARASADLGAGGASADLGASAGLGGGTGPGGSAGGGTGGTGTGGIGGVGGNTGGAGLSSEAQSAFASLSRSEQRRVQIRCRAVLANPMQADPGQWSMCRTLSQLARYASPTKAAGIRRPPFFASVARALAARDRLPVPIVHFGDIRRQRVAEVGHFEHLPDFDLARTGHWIGAALHPLDRLGHVLDLPQPETRHQFVGLRERPVGDKALYAVKTDALALRRRVKTLTGQHDPGLDQFLVVFAHGFEELG